jgi:hypothetical protein
MAANASVPFGFRPVNLYGSGPPNYALNYRQIAYNNTSNKIAYGDPVIAASGNSGYIDLMAVGGSSIHGVLLGVEYGLSTQFGGFQFTNYWSAPTLASTTNVFAKVVNDPTMVFLAQMTGAAQTIAIVGQNIDIVTSSSGAPNFAGISTCALDAANIHTTNTLPFRILGIVGLGAYAQNIGPIPNYNPLNDNQFVYVKMNTSDLLNTTGD